MVFLERHHLPPKNSSNHHPKPLPPQPLRHNLTPNPLPIIKPKPLEPQWERPQWEFPSSNLRTHRAKNARHKPQLLQLNFPTRDIKAQVLKNLQCLQQQLHRPTTQRANQASVPRTTQPRRKLLQRQNPTRLWNSP